MGNEYAALQVEKSGENEFKFSYIESSGSESGDDERKESVIWSEKIFVTSDSHKNTEKSVLLKMKFKSARDGKSGTVCFFVKIRGFDKKVSFKSKPFQTVNAHWVGGRYGFF